MVGSSPAISSTSCTLMDGERVFVALLLLWRCNDGCKVEHACSWIVWIEYTSDHMYTFLFDAHMWIHVRLTWLWTEQLCGEFIYNFSIKGLWFVRDGVNQRFWKNINSQANSATSYSTVGRSGYPGGFQAHEHWHSVWVCSRVSTYRAYL